MNSGKRRLIQSGYTEESVDKFIAFWNDPMVATVFYNGLGEISGYINSKGLRVMCDDELRKIIKNKLTEAPKLIKED